MNNPYFRLNEQGLPEPVDPLAPLPPMPEGVAELRALSKSPDAAFLLQERDGETVIRPIPRIIDDPPPPLMSPSAANRHARRKAAVLARWARR